MQRRRIMALRLEVKMFEVNEEIIMYAFRYSLGRMTPAVSQVTDLLIENWHRLAAYTREQIVREIKEAINSNRAGMDCDIVRWRSVLLLEEATSNTGSGNKEENGSND